MTETLTRKSLLYRSKVEYGGWTINHVQGCSHGCRYPCYAMMLARRTGRARDYEEWTRPKVVENAAELLEGELLRLGSAVDSVHLSFTTDPFMYDVEDGGPNTAVCDMSVRIIERLNQAGIPVTMLTKGRYPEQLVDASWLHPLNRYGVSLVSLSEAFCAEWEPGALGPSGRIESLRRLADAGCRTWVSIEPYPTPNIDETAVDVEGLLEAVGFADAFVFGKWNYNRLATEYDREHSFYEDIARRLRVWCERNGKALHIKKGTPLWDEVSAGILRACD